MMRPVPSARHERQKRLGDAQRADQLAVEIADPIGVGPEDLPVRAPHRVAGVVDDDVDGAERRPRRVGCGLHRLGAGDVGGHRQRVDAVAARGDSAAVAASASMPRARSTRFTPSRASPRAIARPMPLLPPVTTAVRPLSPSSSATRGSFTSAVFSARPQAGSSGGIRPADRARATRHGAKPAATQLPGGLKPRPYVAATVTTALPASISRVRLWASARYI